jgi:hypothetical protein
MREDIQQFFTVRSGIRKFIVGVTVKYDAKEQPFSYKFDIGGKMKGCVQIIANCPNKTLLDDERFASLEKDKNIAFVTWIGYNPKCSLTDDLPNGDGTRHMVRCAMSIVCNACPWVTKFKLNDASTVKCVEGVEISLANLSLFTNGKSYYEKYLHAYLHDEHMRTLYKEKVARLSNPKEKLPLEIFKSKFNITNEHVLSVYGKTSTYIEFARVLKAESEEKQLNVCEIILPWLEEFVKYVLEGYTFWMYDWLIDKESIKHIPVKQWGELSDSQQVRDIIQEEFSKVRVYSLQQGGYQNGSFVLGDL